MRSFKQFQYRDNLLAAFFGVVFLFITLLSIGGHFYGDEETATRSGCGTESLQFSIESLLKNKSRFIAVVGDGVPGESLVIDRPYNTQFAQGYDLYQGVRHALRTRSLQEVQSKVGVLYVDDGGNPSCAAHIADIISKQPRLLGVIGHSTTSCTKEALPFYERANIPVLIPAATNPDLWSGAARNSFRLPSNDVIQALVIADVLVNKFKAKSIFVVWDATQEASQYAEYLKTAIQHQLTAGNLSGESPVPIIEGSYPISLNPMNYSYLFKRIVSSDADAIVFAGYGSLAREFLLGLDAEYAQYGERPRPKVILTDGCKIPGIKPQGFDTYITFSAAPLATLPGHFEAFDGGVKIGRFQKMYLEESFELFGYDAALMLLTAIHNTSIRGQGVSRKDVIHFISAENRMVPTAYSYTFDRGDNTRHRYYCYSLANNAIAYKYEEDSVDALLQRMSRP